MLTTFVAKPADVVELAPDVVELTGLGGLIEEVTRSGDRDRPPVLWQTIIEPTPQVAAILKLYEGSGIMKILWMLRSNGAPASLCTSCFPADLWSRCVGRSLDEPSSYRLLRQRLGPRVKRARQVIDCCRAPKWVASLLHIEPATAVISCRREVFLDDGTPAEYATAYARSDLLKFAFERRRREQQHSAVMGTARTPAACVPIRSTIHESPSID